MRTLVIFFVFLVQSVFAQEVMDLDSLQAIYSNSKDLRIRTETAIQLSKEYNRTNIDSNAKYLDISKQLAEKLKDDRLTASYHLNQGNYFKNTGQYIKGVTAYENAISNYEKLKDTLGLANSYNSLGLIYKMQGGDNRKVKAFSEKGLLYENRALELYQAARDTVGLLRVYSNLGIIHRDLKDFKPLHNIL